VLIDERDRYLATRIYQSQGNHIVAVIGAGLRKGSQEPQGAGRARTELRPVRHHHRPAFLKVGQGHRLHHPAAIIAMIVMGFVNAGWDKGVQMFLYGWSQRHLYRSLLPARLAHPLNILCSMAAAPFTSLNPTIGVGIISGILEAEFRKPKVKISKDLNEDATHFRNGIQPDPARPLGIPAEFHRQHHRDVSRIPHGEQSLNLNHYKGILTK
jgi:pheromone shutdown protein TraB